MASTESPKDDLIYKLEASDWRVRQQAATELSNWPGPDVTLRLGESLQDPNTAVVDAAAESLLTRADPAGVPFLLRALELDEGEAEQVYAQIVRSSAAAWVFSELTSVLQKSDEPQLRLRAAELLGAPDSPVEGAISLEQALDDPDAEVRAAAADSLTEIRRRRAEREEDSG